MKRTSNLEHRTPNTEQGTNRLVLLLVLLLVIGSPWREAKADVAAQLANATQPLADGVPQVAVVRLRQLLAASLTADERRAAKAKLGEALVAANQPEEALKILSEPSVAGSPGADFFRAQALAALSLWSEALPLYEAVARDNASPFRAEALYGQAESLRALSRFDEALQVLASLTKNRRWKVRAGLRSVELLIDVRQDPEAATRILNSLNPTSESEKMERRLLRGRIQVQLNRPERALPLFSPILKDPAGASHSVLIAALLALADAHLQSGTPGTGDNFLEEFIERQPQDPDLPLLFAKLDELYAAERKQSRHELGRWSKDAAQPRASLSRWYLARAELRLGRRDVALQTFEQLRVDHPAFPALAEAFVEYARLQLEDEMVDQAIATLEDARKMRPAPAMLEEVSLLEARSQFQAQRFEVAAQIYRQVAQSSSRYGDDALFNASLAWLQAGDGREFSEADQELARRGANEQTRADLRLEQGLAEATRGEAKATESLQNFVREFPKDPRISEAWVALAELAFHAAPPRLEEARQNLTRAAQSQPTMAAKERAEYLSIWLEEAAPQAEDARVLDLARSFIQKYPESALLPDVRLKLAETAYRRQDFASAQTQFEILAQGNAKSPIAEKAEFFAAQSAMQTMGPASLDRALVLFDNVVKKNGEWKWAARNEQAIIERRLGKPEDALTLYDEVLKGDARATEKREALCGKGDILYELGVKDPANYQRASELYTQLAADSDSSAHWRNQALFKKGMCLEKLNVPAEALDTFYTIIEGESSAARPREFFWFYKAGFNAARLLEEQSNWKSAAAIYEKLAFAGGARSEEAKSRLNRLRLERFLWEE